MTELFDKSFHLFTHTVGPSESTMGENACEYEDFLVFVFSVHLDAHENMQAEMKHHIVLPGCRGAEWGRLRRLEHEILPFQCYIISCYHK